MVLFWAQKLDVFFQTKKVFRSEKVFYRKKFLKNLQLVSDRKKSTGIKKNVFYQNFLESGCINLDFYALIFWVRRFHIYDRNFINKTWTFGCYRWNCIETSRDTLGFFRPRKIEYFFFQIFQFGKIFSKKVGLNFGSVLSPKIKCIFSKKKNFW